MTRSVDGHLFLMFFIIHKVIIYIQYGINGNKKIYSKEQQNDFRRLEMSE